MSVQAEISRTTATPARRGARHRRGHPRLLRRAWVWLVQERAGGPSAGERATVARMMRLAPPH
jgi:hypothetical protein